MVPKPSNLNTKLVPFYTHLCESRPQRASAGLQYVHLPSQQHEYNPLPEIIKMKSIRTEIVNHKENLNRKNILRIKSSRLLEGGSLNKIKIDIVKLHEVMYYSGKNSTLWNSKTNKFHVVI